MLHDDIKSMDSLMSGYARLPIFDVWQRIKKEIVGAASASPNLARGGILLCSLTYHCLAKGTDGHCNDVNFCNCQRNTSHVA